MMKDPLYSEELKVGKTYGHISLRAFHIGTQKTTDLLATVDPPFPEHASRAAATGAGVAGAAAPSDAAGASPGEAAKASWVRFVKQQKLKE